VISAQELIERITAKAPFDDCIVIVNDSTQANLRWANSTLTTNGVIANRSITVIAFIAVEGGMASGAVTRTDIDLHEIDAVIKEAGEAAKSAGQAEDFAPLAKNVSHGDWNSPHHATGPQIFSKIAPELGEMFSRSVKDKIELFGYAEHTHKTLWVGSKGGIRMRHDQPAGRVEMTGKSHQRTRSTWDGVATRDFSNVSIAKIDSHIRQRLQWQEKRIDLPAGRYDTLFPAGSISDLITYMLWMSAGRDAFEGRSAFSKPGGGTRIGEKFSNKNLTLFSDPTYQGLESAHFVSAGASSEFSSVFDNGQMINRTEWISQGSLKNLVTTRASAEMTSLPYAPMGENLVLGVEGGTGSLDDLASRMENGLLVTTLWYIRMVDPQTLLLTGLTRDGIYLVKNGEVQGAVNNFRWNDSPLNILNNIVEAGSTEICQPREWADYVDRVAMPPMIIKDFNMSTVSEAN
jgi:predicted Zn-dependent protease